MAHIRKTDLNAVADRDPLSVLAWHKQLYGIQGILHHIHRLILRLSCSSALAVAPLCLKFLDVRAVTQHNVAEIRCRECGKDLSLKSILRKPWQHSRVVNVRMGKEHIVNILLRDRQPRILIQIRSLLHTAVDQDIFPRRLEEMAASRNFMGRSDKSKFHSLTALFHFSYIVPSFFQRYTSFFPREVIKNSPDERRKPRTYFGCLSRRAGIWRR